MNKNIPSSDNFFASPLLPSQLEPSPYLSPFPSNFRKHSDELHDLLHFSLENDAFQSPQKQLDSVEQPSEEEALLPAPVDQPEQMVPTENWQELEQSPQRFQIPSTKFPELRADQQPPFLLLSHEQQGVPPVQQMCILPRAMIQFLVEHSQLREDMLQVESRPFTEGNPALKVVFMILASKFKKLKKTKEEMTKYCMRKAFKHIGEGNRQQKTSSRDLETYMADYFSDQKEGQFAIPFKYNLAIFRKNSAEKTMNGSFLKKVFSCRQFAEDYRHFLGDFQGVVLQDNAKKVKYLSDLVESALQKGEIETIEKVKRLPWTKDILKQVYELAMSLADQTYPCAASRRHRNQQPTQ